jgi:glycerophosphoryl diester phosphodiesterase
MSEAALPQLVAHRGFLSRYPENTWIGLEAALKAGACWLEFDVQMCADNRFVLLHDADFRRTAHQNTVLFDGTSRDAQRISVHEPQRFGQGFAPLAPPLLDQVLHGLAAFPACRAMVEIKQESLQQWGLNRVMDALLQTLTPFTAGCVLISYSRDALAYAARHSDIHTGWVLRGYDAAHRQAAQQLRPGYLICNHRKITPPQQLWPGRWQWMLYDIVEPQLALDWASRGAALIETADIGGMLADPVLAATGCRHGP